MSETMTIDELGRSVKAKYPQYEKLSDAEVGQKVIEKYPAYKARISNAQPQAQQSPQDEPQMPAEKPVSQPPSEDTAATGFVKGVGKSVLDTVKGASSLGERGLNSIVKTLLPKSLERAAGLENAPTLGIFKKSTDAPTSAESLQTTAEQGLGLNEGDLTEARGTAQTVGKVAGDVAQFFIPAGGAAKAGKVLEGVAAARKIGKIGQFGARVLPGALADLGIAEAQNGGKDHAEALMTAGGAIAGEAALSAAGKAVKTAFPKVFGAADDAAKGTKSVFGTSNAVQSKAVEQAASKAVKTGVDENVVHFVRSSTPEDKAVYKKMFDTAETGSKDLRFREQPKQIAGKTVLGNAEHLLKVKDQGVAQTKHVLDSLGAGKQDASGILRQFLDDMEQKGVVTVRRGNGVQLVPTKGSRVVEEDLPFYQSIFKKLMPDKKGNVSLSYREMHGLRQYIFEKLSLAKSRNQAFSGDLERYGEQLRRYIADPINEASGGKYMASQQRTAEAMSALREFVQLMGYKGNLENLAAKDLKVGEVASRIFGNAADRPMSVLQQLSETAKKYGYKAKGNYIDQLQFADILENYFSPKQTRSLRGQVAGANMDALKEAAGAVKDAATGSWLALGTRAAKAIFGKSEGDQIKALRELLDIETKGIRAPSVFGKKVIK